MIRHGRGDLKIRGGFRTVACSSLGELTLVSHVERHTLVEINVGGAGELPLPPLHTSRYSGRGKMSVARDFHHFFDSRKIVQNLPYVRKIVQKAPYADQRTYPTHPTTHLPTNPESCGLHRRGRPRHP